MNGERFFSALTKLSQPVTSLTETILDGSKGKQNTPHVQGSMVVINLSGKQQGTADYTPHCTNFNSAFNEIIAFPLLLDHKSRGFSHTHPLS